MTWQEGTLLAWIETSFGANVEGVLLGPGDDAALVAFPGSVQAITVDQVVEGIHYDEGTPAEAVARKLVGRNLSDLAAMGATPRFAVVASSASDAVAEVWLRTFLGATVRELSKHGARLVGGDLSLARSGFTSSLTLMGQASSAAPRRSGGRAGDDLWVSGSLGGSRAGRHLAPPDRVALGRRLVEVFDVACMMDLSDGLILDLQRLCRASKLRARVALDQVPIHPDAIDVARESHRRALEHALADGEDYELLFSLAPAHRTALEDGLREGDCPLTRIGTLVDGAPGIDWLDARGEPVRIEHLTGFEHGGSPS